MKIKKKVTDGHLSDFCPVQGCCHHPPRWYPLRLVAVVEFVQTFGTNVPLFRANNFAGIVVLVDLALVYIIA